jgi:O-antigen/teichoic acid export membrane protein
VVSGKHTCGDHLTMMSLDLPPNETLPASPVRDESGSKDPMTRHGSSRGILSRNALASASRVIANSLVLLFLPICLTHWMSVARYAAWVLILQLGAYVLFLDLGIQTGVAKFVAQYVERRDLDGASRSASAGMAIMLAAAMLGVLLTFGLVWQIPKLLGAMPTDLYRDVRLSMLLIGLSQSIGLVGSVFSAIFFGLQRYTIPIAIAILNRSLFAAAVIVVAYFRGSLWAMGMAGAAVTLFTGLLQYMAWKRSASFVRVRLRLIQSSALKEMMQYCSVLAVWSGAMLCISGLDIVLVGHYEFSQTGYYSIATLPNSLMITLLTAVLSPLIPAASALRTRRTAIEMGEMLIRTARYSSLFLLLCGMPLIVCGQLILHLWVGPAYAQHTLMYLRILVIANLIRYAFAPYATMIVALGRQKAATASCVLEASVNLAASLFLARQFGAIGVAYGTLLGAVVGVSVHYLISMRRTQSQIDLSPVRYLKVAAAIPLLIAVLALSAIVVERNPGNLVRGFAALLLCEFIIGVLGWMLLLNPHEREQLLVRAHLKTRQPKLLRSKTYDAC